MAMDLDKLCQEDATSILGVSERTVRKVENDDPTQVGRALGQLGIELIAAYSPEARGRSEAMFGTLQKRLPQEMRLAGVTTMEEANRFLKETYLPAHNARFAVKPSEPGSAFVPFAGSLKDILCVLVVALANKLARIAWSVLNRGRAYDASL